MWIDPIVEEVRNARYDHAEKFDFDIDAIVQDLQKKQNESSNKVVSFTKENNVNVEGFNISK
jgi:hypothetical protein